MSLANLKEFRTQLKRIHPQVYSGKVCKITGLTIESSGPVASLGDICKVYTLTQSKCIHAEVVGFKNKNLLLMPYGDLVGIGQGSKVESTNSSLIVPVGMELKGRILDGIGNPMDGKKEIKASEYYNTDNPPPNPLTRARIKETLTLGVKAIDSMLTCGRGQRIGIFAGSGVGKSTLLGMIARNAQADINVITLIGERGREVREFIEKDLREEGMARSILVVATSDQPAIIRLKAAMVGTSIAEYFRDQGLNVLLLMDSLTRYAMAQREIGMSVGEPPVSRGYTPSVFTLIPKLLERAGNSAKGSITGMYTVLVEGDDMNEPIADTVRGVLDGHIVLSRALANKNHYPAIDVLASVSRLMPEIVSDEHFKVANQIKNRMAVYNEAQDLINIGAYQSGRNPEIDESIRVIGKINSMLKQQINESFPFAETMNIMHESIK